MFKSPVDISGTNRSPNGNGYTIVSQLREFGAIRSKLIDYKTLRSISISRKQRPANEDRLPTLSDKPGPLTNFNKLNITQHSSMLT